MIAPKRRDATTIKFISAVIERLMSLKICKCFLFTFLPYLIYILIQASPALRIFLPAFVKKSRRIARRFSHKSKNCAFEKSTLSLDPFQKSIVDTKNKKLNKFELNFAIACDPIFLSDDLFIFVC